MVARLVTDASANPPDHRQASRTLPANDVDLDLSGESDSSQLVEICSRRTLYDHVPVCVHLEQPIKRRRVRARVEAPTAAASAGGIGDDDGVTGDGRKRVGAAKLHPADVVAGHRKPHRVQIASDDETCRIPKRRKLGADRTGDVVHDCAGESTRPMAGNRARGGLLQRLVGEEPAVGIGELARRLAPQQRGLHEHCDPLTESCPYRSDVGDPRGIGEPVAGHLVEGQPTVLAAEIGDVVDAERYDGVVPRRSARPGVVPRRSARRGLVPVTITL